MAAGAVAIGLVLMLVWPAGNPAPADAPQAPSSLAAWPARGPLATDSSQVRDSVAAWRGVAAGSGIPTPGDDVDVLYLGDPDGVPVALLHSTREGRALVAAGLRERAGWRILDAVPIDRDVSWLTVPGAAMARALAAPEVAAASSLVLRRADGVWNRVAIGADGVTGTLRSLGGSPTILGVIEGRGAQRGLADVAALSPTSIVPVSPPVQPVPPDWGRTTMLTAEEYDAALFALPAVPGSAWRLSVLTAARVPGGRAVLVQTTSADDGRIRHLLVVPSNDGQPVLGPAPVVSDELAAGVVDRGGGRLLVLAASAPSVGRVEVRSPDGTTLVDGIGATGVVLPAPAPPEVTVLGKRTNGSVTASIRVPLSESDPRPPVS